jgi:hypothetical protein
MTNNTAAMMGAASACTSAIPMISRPGSDVTTVAGEYGGSSCGRDPPSHRLVAVVLVGQIIAVAGDDERS